MDQGRRAQMADELPLAEISAGFVRMSRSKGTSRTNHGKGPRQASQECEIILRLAPESIPPFNAMLDGPSGDGQWVLKIYRAPFDWETGPVDPNQGEDEKSSTEVQLLEEWREIRKMASGA